MTRKKVEPIAESIQKEHRGFITDVAMRLVELTEEDHVLEFVGTALREFVGEAYIIVNKYHMDSEESEVVGLRGPGNEWLKKAVKILGQDPIGMRFPIKGKDREGMLTGKLMSNPSGMYELSGGQLNKTVAGALDRFLGIEKIYGMGFSCKGVLYGNLVIITGKKTLPFDKATVESIAHMAALAIQREHAKGRFQALIEKSSDVVILISNKFDIEYASPSFEKVFGKSSKDFLNTPITDFFTNHVHPDNLDAVIESFEKCAESPGQECRAEFQFKHADGTWHYFVAVGQNHLGTPAVNGLIVNLRDITEQKKASQALTKSRALLRDTAEMAKIGGWEFFIDTLTQTWTEETFRILEVDFDKGAPKVPEGVNFIAEEYRPMADKAIQRAMEFGEPYDQEWEVVTAKGNRKWVRAVAKINRENGKVKSVSGSFQDITDRINAEIKMRDLAKFPSENPNPVLRVRKDGTLLYANDACFKFLPEFGLKLGEKVPEYLMETITATIDINSTDTFEIGYGNRTMSFVTLEVSGTDYFNLYGRDITDRKHHEAEIENLNSFLLSIRNLNQEIVKESDFDRLLNSSCRILTEIRGYMDVSIAFLDESDHAIKPRAHHGSHGRNSWQFSEECGSELPPCIRRMAVEGHAFVMSNGDLDCRDCSFCPHDTDHQSLLVPMLDRSGNLAGIITACLEPGRAIHPNEIPLFEEVAGDLVFAYEKICIEKSLEESETMFHNLFDTMAQGVVYQDAEGKITSANAAAERILGLSLDQMQDRTSVDPRWKAIHEDGSEYPGEEHPAMVALGSGKPTKGVMGIFNPESEEHRWINVYAVPEFRLDEEKPYRVYTTLEDITPLKNTMAEMERRKDFIFSVLNNLTIGVAVNKIETGEAIFINPMFARTYGWPPEDFVDIPTFFEQVYPDPEYRIPLQERVMADIESMDPERMHWEELVATAKDGSKRYISARNIPLPKENLMISTVWDVTEHKKAEMEIIASETRYRRLFESAKDGILILDAKSGNIVDVNPFLVDLLGIPSEKFLGKKLWEIGFFKDIAANEANFIELQKKGYVRYEDMPLETKDGRRIDVEFVSNVYDVNDSKVIQCNIRDITTRKQAEDELRVLTMKLQTIADEKTRELEAIHATMLKQERLSLLGQMAASVSHELRNPLSVINNVAYYLRMQHPELDEKSVKMLDILEKEVERSDRIIGNMLGFSRAKSNLSEPLDINELVKQYFADQDRLPGNIQLNLELADNLPTLNADMEKLLQVLDNLVTNACHAMPDGGTLTIASKAGDDSLELSVRDTGHGMSPDVQKKIFEPLFSTKTTGFGLGLVVVKTLVEDHRGIVKVNSEEGKGTEFTVSLPLDGGNAGNESGRAGGR